MAIRLLRGAQVIQHAHRFVERAGSEQAAGGFHEVARPYQVVAAEVVVPLAGAPRDGQAGDEAAGEAWGFVGAQHGGADAVAVMVAAGMFHGAQTGLPLTPGGRIHGGKAAELVLQAGAGAEGRLGGTAAKAQRQIERTGGRYR